MTLPATIDCAECQHAVASMLPGRGDVSRAAVNDVHWQHRPPHPNETGSAHRSMARRAWDEWERLSPYRDQRGDRGR
jgi:hypothetical protein